jgi:predicted restriction endonuclease
MDIIKKHHDTKTATTPEDKFFKEQRDQIWVKAMADEKRTNHRFLNEPRQKLAFAAVFLALVSAAGFALFSAQSEHCETFICLLEASDKKSLQISETDLEQWLSEDELFWEISESL